MKVGIDLGTTHTVVAYAEPGRDGGHGGPTIRLFEIDQLVGAGEVAAQTLLPSVRYQAAAGELAGVDLQLPWTTGSAAGTAPQVVIGRWALGLGAQVPGRLVTSAKSWLSHAAVDRSAAILPWGADDDAVVKVSPLAASASYLAHVRSAWNVRFPEAPLERQSIVLTVPASFDESARALTLQAARLAQLPDVHLLEEPQAALYDWLHSHRDDLATALAASRLVLVCDVGGGTTDLSLIQVELRDGEPRLTRVAVGEHLMLGGDNMDLALAHEVERRLGSADGTRLSAPRLALLTQRCRDAKEQLLAADAPERVTVTLLGAGSRVVGGARSVEMERDTVRQMLVDGFLPMVDAAARPLRARGALVEFGLPYASDPAITRHLAAFLNRHATAARAALGERAPPEGALCVPDTLLLNGGVFRGAALAERLAATLQAWSGYAPIVLRGPQLDAAVARGAVAYALAREGAAPRIGGGSARSHFLVLNDRPDAHQAVCVLARGTEAGQEVRLTERSFALRVGQPVAFHLVSSDSDAGARPGDLIDFSAGDFVRLPPLATVMSADATRARVEVQLSSVLTEVGTLEMHCVGIESPAARWRLEFQVRSEAPASVAEPPHPRLADAIDCIEKVFGGRQQEVQPRDVRQLRQQLERLLGDRERWSTPLLRELYGALWQRQRRRRRSATHERTWLNLAGYCLRPGFGSALDSWRVEQFGALFEAGLQHTGESQLWSDWWTMWRRVAAGLSEDRQLQILNELAYDLQPPGAAFVPRPPGPRKGGYDDMVRLAASLERIGAEHKVTVGDWLIQRLRKPSESVQGWWAIGRLGAREPFSASAHNVVAPEMAQRWLESLFALDWQQVEPAAFAAAQIARLTGDRSRDLSIELRERVVRRLEQARAPPGWIRMLREQVALDDNDRRRMFGETLPAGLLLLH